MVSRTTSPGQSASTSRIMVKLPTLLLIFSPSTCKKPLCIQKFAITLEWNAQHDCAISFSWCGKTRSMPPPWISNVSPRCFHDIAEHSMCQPGRPGDLMPDGDGHDGSPGFDGFHRTKSMASRLYGATSM